MRQVVPMEGHRAQGEPRYGLVAVQRTAGGHHVDLAEDVLQDLVVGIMKEIKKRVYRFGGKTAEGDGKMRELLGGKGANLAEMNLLGMPVPAGFTITTECCTEYYRLGGGYTPELKAEVAAALEATEKIMGKKFGDAKDPLLVSCRSGARSSMPGMMDTILNIGLCSKTIPVTPTSSTVSRRP